MISNIKEKIKHLNINDIQLYLFGLYFLLICIFEDNHQFIKYTGIVLFIFGLLELFNIIKIKKVSFNLPIIFAFLFALFGILSSLWAYEYHLALEKGRTIFFLSIFLLVSYNYFNRIEKGAEKLLKTIAIVGILFSIFVLVYYNPIEYFIRLVSGERIGFEIANVNSIGMKVIVSFVVCIYYALFKSQKKYYLFSLIPLIVTIGCGSRKTFFFAGLSIIIMLLYYMFNNKNKKTRIIIISSLFSIILLVLLLYILKVPFIVTQADRLIGMVNGVLGIGDADHSTMLRMSYIRIGVDQFVKAPIFGIGLDNARLINYNPTYLHNNYVELLATVGIIGFVLYYAIYFIIFYYFIKNRKKFNENYLICLCIIFCILILDYGTVSYYSKTTFIYFLMCFLVLNVKNIDVNLSKIILFMYKIVLKLMNLGFFNWMSDEQYLKLRYWLTFGKKLDLVNPKTFNEKLQWLKLNDNKEEYTTLVDKDLVKKYVGKIIGKKYIIPTLGVYDSFDDIDFSTLPNSFVIKCTHDSGGVVIVKDKSKLDINKTRRKINGYLKHNYYYLGREKPYKNVKPRILIEKYLSNNNKELSDYKFFCFSGKVGLTLICSDRSTNVKFSFFNNDGNFINVRQCGAMNDPKVKLPKRINEMKTLAEKLSKNMIHIRVDFYEIDDKIYFGELTFFDSSGFGYFDPDKWDKKIGDMIVLPKK